MVVLVVVAKAEADAVVETDGEGPDRRVLNLFFQVGAFGEIALRGGANEGFDMR